MKKIVTHLLIGSSLLLLTGCQSASKQQESQKEEKVSMTQVVEKINDDKLYAAEALLEQMEKQGDKNASNTLDALHDFQEASDELRRGNFKDAKRLVAEVQKEAECAALQDKAAQLEEEEEEIDKEEQNVQNEKTERDEKEENQSHNEHLTNKKTESLHEYSNAEKESMSASFLQWAIPRAQTAKMAVTDAYNVHGASSAEDIYINTPDGKVLVEGNGNNGEYVAEAVAGLLFCYTKNGETGSLTLGNSTASLFNNVALNRKANKYILASNGVVYEAKGTGSQLVGYGGFCQGSYSDGVTWIVSEDTAAQAEASRLLS